MEQEICTHLQEIIALKEPKEYICQECVKTHSNWLHLRTCQTCGVTLCCDDSPKKHMTHHFHETSHPVVISAEPGERWLYCYKDDMMVEY